VPRAQPSDVAQLASAYRMQPSRVTNCGPPRARVGGGGPAMRTRGRIRLRRIRVEKIRDTHVQPSPTSCGSGKRETAAQNRASQALAGDEARRPRLPALHARARSRLGMMDIRGVVSRAALQRILDMYSLPPSSTPHAMISESAMNGWRRMGVEYSIHSRPGSF